MTRDESKTESRTIRHSPDTGPDTVDEQRRLSLVIYHRNGIKLEPLSPGRELTIGRAPPADVVIRDSSLSRRHARVDLVGDEVWIEDLRSTNGTTLNGKKIDRAQVRLDDRVIMGSVHLSLHVLTPLSGQLHWLDSHDRFFALLEGEVARSRTFGRKLAMLMVRAVAGYEGHLGQWCPRIRELLRPVDQMGLYGPDVVEILLPEADLRQAEQLANVIVYKQKSGDTPLLCSVAIYPDAATSSEELLEVCRTALQGASFKDPVHAVGMSDGATVPSLGTAVRGEASGWIISSPVMQQVDRTIDRIARSTIAVLIIGETGAGKEVVARAIHERSDRRDGPMLCINCGAIPEHLVESALFGHERGAFTGADRRSRGVFEQADGGSLLLDEIGELSLHSQVALLRVLDTRRITRVGSSQEIGVNVRILAATNKDLQRQCDEGAFRSDLLFRLNTMLLKIPPLRERPEEIRPLALHFIRLASEANGCAIKTLSPEALELLERYDWPGNVRELRNVIERAVVIAPGELITVEDLPERLRQFSVTEAGTWPGLPRRKRHTVEVRKPDSAAAAEPSVAAETAEPGFKSRVQQLERSLIIEALSRTDGNQTRAAKLLGIARLTLINKIQGYKIDRRLAEEPRAHGCAENEPLDLKVRIQALETELIQQALQQTEGNVTKAAEILGIPRYALASKISRYGLK